MALPKLCSEQGCRVIVRDGKHKCINHRWIKRNTEVVERSRFYSTSAWKILSLGQRQLRPICEMCEKDIATDADHWCERILDPEEAYWLDSRNIVCLCKSCHYSKGNKMQRLMQKNDNNGIYLWLLNNHPRPSEAGYLHSWIETRKEKAS